MSGGFFIFLGLTLVGVSLYSLYGDYLLGNSEDAKSRSLTSLTDRGYLAESPQYDVIPQPVSSKPLFIILTVASVSASLLLFYYLINYSETTTSRLWIFVLSGACAVLGALFFNAMGEADTKILERQQRITSVNKEITEQKKQEVQFAYLAAEEEKQAELRQLELINQRKNQEILANLYNEAHQLGIPLENLAGLNEEKIRAQIQVQGERQMEEHKTQQGFIRDLNTQKVEAYGDQQKIANINRVEYNLLSSKLIKEIGDLEEKIVILKADKEIARAVKKVRIENLQRDIKNKEFQLDALQTGLVNADYREEGKRLIS